MLLKDKNFDEKGKNQAKMVIKRKLNETIDILNKYSWDVDVKKLSMLLSAVFYPDYSIRFIPSNKENPGLLELGGLYPNGDIDLYVYPSLSQYFSKFRQRENWKEEWTDYDQNQFIQRFIEEVAQMLFFRDKKLEKFENHMGIMPMQRIQDYLKQNADVYVLEAIDEVEETGGVSNVLGIYKEFFGPDSKVYKTFLEKVKEKSSVKKLKGVF